MGKQKQQVISRFFAPKSKLPYPSTSSSPPLHTESSLQSPPTPPPKISATVTFSPSKRLRTSQLTSPTTKPSRLPGFSSHTQENNSESLTNRPSKNPNLSAHTHNPIPHLPNPSLHQRFLNKLLEPSGENFLGCSPKPPISNPKYTPLEQQVVDLKAKYPDVLLMVEVGYRYRFFGEDAENAARVLGIYAHVDHNFLTASVPTFRLNVHVRRLVSAGYKVGVVKQSETAAIKAHGSNRLGPFCRGLSALYTKATLEAAEDIGNGEEGCGSCNNYLICVVEKRVIVDSAECRIESGFDVRIGIVAVEISTGDVVYGEFNDNFTRAGLEAVILNLSPAELLLGEPLSKQTEKVVFTLMKLIAVEQEKEIYFLFCAVHIMLRYIWLNCIHLSLFLSVEPCNAHLNNQIFFVAANYNFLTVGSRFAIELNKDGYHLAIRKLKVRAQLANVESFVWIIAPNSIFRTNEKCMSCVGFLE
ncbi:Mismatch repair protein msh3 [Sarracenia purpurea var. burkii]